jgi:hypothetical protein
MADWRHIQGKIRKARTSSDPHGQLAALYESTRDAMVAFELARLFEKAGSNAEAAQWYLVAAEKFRRAQWKVKAQEALVRLGVEVPLAATEAEAQASAGVPGNGAAAESVRSGELFATTETPTEFTESSGEPDANADEGLAAPGESEGEGAVAVGGMIEGVAGDAGKKRRRRGRRGGRGRRKKPPVVGAAPTSPVLVRSDALPAQGEPTPINSRPAPRRSGPTPSHGGSDSRRRGPERVPSRAPERTREAESHEVAASAVGTIGPAAWQARRPSREPALASRLTLLESQLRRMLAAPANSLEDPDRAPAGPGVFVLSDSELIDHYYVEACQTLRIGIGNMVRTGRTRSGDNLRGRLAEHLGITESRVAKYLKDHCSVRWIQLDEEAPLLAHYAIAVLRPALNE